MPSETRETFVVAEDDCRKRLDVFLAENVAGVTRSGIKNLLKAGLVTVDGEARKAGHRLRRGESVEIAVPGSYGEPPAPPGPEEIPLDILYEDGDIIVVDKPAGMAVHPGAGRRTGTLAGALLAHTRSLSTLGGPERPGIVHRLDSETSGVMVVAKNDSSHARLAEQFREHTTQRTYVALVWGAPEDDTGVIDLPIGRDVAHRKKISPRSRKKKRALTRYRVLKRYPLLSLLELRLETGRTHQIRVHLSAINHPVVGDRVYTKRKPPPAMAKPVADAIKGVKRQCLHARTLGFTHPASGERMEFDSPVPEEMAGLIEVIEAGAERNEEE